MNKFNQLFIFIFPFIFYGMTASAQTAVFPQSEHTSEVKSAVFSSDGRQMLFGSADGSVKLWDTAAGRETRAFFGHKDQVTSAAFNADGKLFISGSFDKTVKLWDAAAGQEIRTFLGHTEKVTSAAFSPNGRHIISASEDCTIRHWDIETGGEIRTFSVHSQPVTSVAFNPDGGQAASGFADGTIKFLDLITGLELRSFQGHAEKVTSVAFNADGRQVISGSSDKTVKLWDAAAGTEIRTLSGHKDEITSVAFSPNGRQIISGSRDKTIKLWDVSSGREIRTYTEQSRINSIAISPDGTQIISGSADGAVCLWNTAAGVEIARFFSFSDGEWIVITPDGYYNASPNGDKRVNVRAGDNVYGMDQYRSVFYMPQITQARLQVKVDPVRVTTTIQQAAEPPSVIIRSPSDRTSVTSGSIELSVVAEDQKHPVKNIKIFVNGRLVGGGEMNSLSGTRGLSAENTGINVTENQTKVDFRFQLALTAGENRIEVLASNHHSEGRAGAVVNFIQSAPPNVLPNLYILSIGINRYFEDRIPDLNYAASDAAEIISLFKRQEGRLYRSVNTRLIADGALSPTRENIISGFNFLRQAGQRDVALLFIAAQGMNDEAGNFYLMPSDAAFNTDGSIRPIRAISWREILAALDIPGQKIVFIDACHSESGRRTRSVDNTRLVRSLSDRSTVVFTSGRSVQISQEDPKSGSGIFTRAILQGMRGEANQNRDRFISINELGKYLSDTIPKLTNNLQSPITHIPEGFANFMLGRLE